MNRLVLSMLIAISVVMINQVSQAQTFFSITDLGDLPGGTESIVPTDINDSGIVVGSASVGSQFQAFSWDSGGFTVLPDLPQFVGAESIAQAINNNGQVVGSNGGAALWNGSVPAFLGDEDQPFTSTRPNRAWDINNGGKIVGTTRHGHAFLWEDGTLTEIANPSGGSNSSVSLTSINDLGQVTLVYGTDDGGPQAGIWNNGPFTSLNTPSYATHLVPNEINNNGVVVGDAYHTGSTIFRRAFLWSNGTITSLGSLFQLPSSGSSRGLGINDKGQIVGESANYEGTANAAFLWENNSMFDLNGLLDSSGVGWTLTSAKAINSAGQIVGSGINPNGNARGFLLTPLHEPTSIETSFAAGISLSNSNLSLINDSQNTQNPTAPSTARVLDSENLIESADVTLRFVRLDNTTNENETLRSAESFVSLASDILQVEGLNGVLHVVDLSYDLALGEATELRWFDAGEAGVEDDAWVNAVLGNSNVDSYDFQSDLINLADGSSGSLSQFLDDHLYSNLSYEEYLLGTGNGVAELGAYGFDSNAKTIWGVIDHNSSFGAAAVPEPVLLGDCNHDGVVDFLDISPFISILSGGDYLAEADVNEDEVVDFLDISPFISILSGS